MVNGYKIYTKPDYPYFRLNFKILVVSNDANWLILHRDMPQTLQATPQVAELLRGYKNCGVVTHKEKNDSTF